MAKRIDLFGRDDVPPELSRSLERRRFLKAAAAGTLIAALGGTYVLAADDDPRAKQKRPDGRLRLPPGQRLLDALRPMGGEAGNPSPGAFRLRVYGDVDKAVELDFAALLALPQTQQSCDVHCVTGWSMLDSKWTGVQLSALANLVKPKPEVRHVILEAANGYTSNIRLDEAMKPNVLVVHRLGDNPIPRPHGPPVRALVPDLYFWKSAKWLTAVRFVKTDVPGYWETRGYHNHADPWTQERYS